MEFLKLVILFFILRIKNNLSFIAYFQLEIGCINDYPREVTTSEGIFNPINPTTQWSVDRDKIAPNYIFYFPLMKHNFENPICIGMINLCCAGVFAFNKACINEYDITILNYEDYYYCQYCNYMSERKRYLVSSDYCGDTLNPMIYTSDENNQIHDLLTKFCLNPTNNISHFYINENKINTNFYKGKKVEYIINNKSDIFSIDNIFTINGNESLQFFLDVVSFKIVNITNKEKAHIYNGDEELFENSFFNAKNNYLSFQKIVDEGFLMIIKIQTKPLNMNINISTCEEEAEIYLYVYQKNCTINTTTNDFCQNCIPNYAKLENKCYEKTEKIDNYYLESSNQAWKECQTNENIFICSVCPQGTYIKSISTTQICEKCDIGYYNDKKDSETCKECPINYYSDEEGSSYCKKCEDNKYSLLGFTNCKDCEKVISDCNICSKDAKCLECNNNAKSGYDNCTICENEIDWKFKGKICQPSECTKYFYKDKKDNNNIICINNITECPTGMNFLNKETRECKDSITINDIISNQTQVKGKNEIFDEITNNLIFKADNLDGSLVDFLNESRIIVTGINSKLQIGYVENMKDFYKDNIGINLDNCLNIIRAVYK